MSSRTTAHTPTTDPMIGASLGRVTELEIVGLVSDTDRYVVCNVSTVVLVG